MKKIFAFLLPLVTLVSTAAELPGYFQKEAKTVFPNAAAWQSAGN